MSVSYVDVPKQIAKWSILGDVRDRPFNLQNIFLATLRIRIFFLRKKKHNPTSPLQVKWSFPKAGGFNLPYENKYQPFNGGFESCLVQLHRSHRLKVSSGLYVRTRYLMDWFYKQKDFYNHSLLYYTVNYNELVYIMYIWRVTALCLFTFITLYLYLLMTFLGKMKETLVLSSA